MDDHSIGCVFPTCVSVSSNINCCEFLRLRGRRQATFVPNQHTYIPVWLQLYHSHQTVSHRLAYHFLYYSLWYTILTVSRPLVKSIVAQISPFFSLSEHLLSTVPVPPQTIIMPYTYITSPASASTM